MDKSEINTDKNKQLEQNITENNFDFKSDDEFDIYIENQIKKEIQVRQLKNDGKNVPFDSDDILNIIIKYYKPKYQIKYDSDDSFTVIYYIKNFNSKLPIYKRLDIESIVVDLATIIKIKDVSKTTKDISIRLKKRKKSKLKDLEKLKLPQAHIILMNNGVLNLKTLEFSEDLNKFGKFDFLNKTNFNMPTDKTVNKLYLEIVKRIFNDWSDNKPDNLLYLKQLCFAALEGNGRQMYHILKAGGGNGKSTFLYILENLAGHNYTIQLDLHNLMDDNSLTKMSLSNKLLVGHDLATNTKLSSKTLSRFKELTTGEAFQINVKYKDNLLIQSKGLKIQSTNSDISFFENTDAIRRRLCIFSWTETKFHEENLENKLETNLDKLIGLTQSGPNKEFYEALIYFILSDMEYFDKFSVPQSAIDNTDAMVNDADNVYQFLTYMKDNELMIGKMLTTHLYKLYKNWLQVENSGSKPLNNKAFMIRIKNLTNKFDMQFELDKKNNPMSITATFKELDCNLDYYNELYQGKLNLLKRDRSYVIKFKEQITDNDIDEFKQALEKDINQFSLDELSYKETMMQTYLLKQGYMEVALIN